jgi:thiamine biosynthesis protein ThiS
MSISIRVNGVARDVREDCTVAGLVVELGLRRELIAVERNGAIVRRVDHEATRLAPGDVLEIVTLVGGG